jgi:mono/diheme cytochrome c family protein
MKTMKSGLLMLAAVLSAQTYSLAEDTNKGIGPITSVQLGPIDSALAAKGKQIFQSKCSACHKPEERYVGPALKGVTQRRTPEWIMNMILNPQEMLQKDPTAIQLLEEYMAQMASVDITKDDARAVLEHFRNYDNGGDTKGKATKTSKKAGKQS